MKTNVIRLNCRYTILRDTPLKTLRKFGKELSVKHYYSLSKIMLVSALHNKGLTFTVIIDKL